MKYITFTVPCYNSAAYMERCVDSLLIGGEDVEILLIDDGSTDRTGEIADEYERNYPGIVRAVHKSNGGHGSGVNAGLHLATGCYFKVVDSDDWLSEDAYRRLLARVKEFCTGAVAELMDQPDLIVCNYTYNHLEEGTAHTMAYRNVFPAETPCTWNDIGHFRPSQYLIMHALIYRTSVLRETGVCLPEHTFYVDNIFVFEPLPYVKKMYYINTNFYRYFIGRDDQSVNETVMISRIDQQLRVTRRMVDFYTEQKISNQKCRMYMRNYLRIMMEVSSIFLILSGTPENLAKKQELWNYVKAKDKEVYKMLRYSMLGFSVNLPGKSGRWISKTGYKVMNKWIGFN